MLKLKKQREDTKQLHVKIKTLTSKRLMGSLANKYLHVYVRLFGEMRVWNFITFDLNLSVGSKEPRLSNNQPTSQPTTHTEREGGRWRE